ncbi:MAG: NADH-quinone oxidoreductase subunit NuoH [Desulfurivibrionaceae bacterium]|nr:NADH-quinone oxidoreductase subunit NuoH [Desulfurivibrionaceae bacterium]
MTMDLGINVFEVFIYLVGFIAFAAANAAYLVWVERKGAAHIQRRTGPKEVGPYGLLQPLADGAKLMSKQFIIPEGVDRPLFLLAPIMTMVPAIMIFVTIPFSETILARDFNIGLLMILAFASVNVLALLMGGWASRNKYAVISAARVVSQNIAYEIPMLIIAITIVLITGSMNLTEIVAGQAGGILHWNLLPTNGNFLGPITFIIFFICSMAETNRAPFDLGEAESELIAGFHTEYSSMGFGLFFMGEYANIVIAAALTTILFLGGWYSPLPETIPYAGASSVAWFLVKMYLLIWMVVLIRWTYPRVTLWSLLNLSWKILIPFSLFNLLASAGLVKFLG